MEKHKTTVKAEPGRQELFITRDFDAPCELVFRALVDPKLVSKWLRYRDLVTKIERFDAKPGGQYRFVQKDGAGNVFAFNGVFHKVTEPKQVIRTFEYEGNPGHVMLETVTFETLPNGSTRMITQAVFQSVADRDFMIESGMEKGVDSGYEHLTDLLEEMKRG